MKKLDYIDALRGIAILAVLISHYRPNGLNYYPVYIQNIVLNASRGVQLFYIVSAFTLFLSYSKREDIENDVVVNFFIRRFLRIAPMYYMVCFYYILQSKFFSEYSLASKMSINNWAIISNFLLIHGFNPYWIHSVVPVGWSVAVEVQFYCFVPLLFNKIKNLNQAVLFFLTSVLFNSFLSLVLTKFSLGLTGFSWESFVLFWLPNQLPTFACGIIVFFLITKPKAEWKVSSTMILISSICVLADLSSGKKILFSDTTFFSLFFALIIYAFSKGDFIVFINRFTRYVGKISYSMYLIHYPILTFMIKLNIISLIVSYFEKSSLLGYFTPFFCFLLLTALVSSFFYKFIEVPFQKLGTQIIKRNKKSNNLILPPVVP